MKITLDQAVGIHKNNLDCKGLNLALTLCGRGMSHRSLTCLTACEHIKNCLKFSCRNC
jgi:hypothetical protein